MEHAKIAIFEDDDTSRELLTDILENSGHQVVAQGSSFEQSVYLAEAIEPGKVDVVLLDGNLTKGRDDSKEGSQIAGMLRAKLADQVKIISISGSTSPVHGVDKDIPKYDSDKIREYIAEL